MYGCFDYLFICATCVCNVLRSQKRATNYLGLELQVIVYLPVGVENQPQVLPRRDKCSYLLGHLSSSKVVIEEANPGLGMVVHSFNPSTQGQSSMLAWSAFYIV